MIDSRCHKFLACLLCSTIIFSIIPFNIGRTVKADTNVNYEGDKPSSDCSYRSVEEAYFSAEVKTTRKWSGHSNIEIKFKNTGTETIHDWYFTFDFNYKIENPFNCRVIESKDNLYTIGNNDWNQDIKPGQSVTVGFTAASKDGSEIKDMPTFYLLNTETVTLKSGDLKYKYEEYSNWSSGFNGALILTNKTKETIRDWTITFGANRPITQADSAAFTDNADGTYTITNDGNNQNIAKGQSYRIGIQGGSNDPSKSFTLTDFTATAKKMALKLTDDKDMNGIADVLEVDFNGTVTVTPTEIPTSTPTTTSTPSATATPKATNSPTATPTATNTPTVKPTTTNTPRPTATNTPTVKPTNTAKPTSTSTPKPTATQKPTVTNTPTSKPTVTSSPRPTATNTPTAKPTNTVTPIVTVTPEPTVTATPTSSPTPDISVTPTNTVTTTPSPTATPTGIPDDIDYEKDTDKDGLPDDIEDYYGTNKNKKDTDDDGVNDLYEMLLATDPLTKDDNGSKDADGDGLTNAKESQIGTNPKNRDSDLDGLTDGAEVNLHRTDPNKDDTDDDGISDAGEISLGSNPNKKDSDILRRQTLTFYPKTNSKLDGVTKVEVGGYISGYIEENTKITDIYGKDLHTSSIEALVGVPVNVETTGDFDSMYIKFYYEEGEFDEENLMIMWYDEENGEYVVLTDDVFVNYDLNYILVYTDHFSKYMLIDEKVWVSTWIKAAYTVKDPELNNVGGGGFFPLGSIEDFKKNKLEKYGDKDFDDIPDILETNGMIDNIGHVIFTDPNKADHDDDYLTDGVEMGQMSTMLDIFERSPYNYYYPSFIVSSNANLEGYVYFKTKSVADNDDGDGDGSKDGVDDTPNDKNQPINYILMGKDNPFEFEISIMKDPYKKAFKTLGEKVVVLDIYRGGDFDNRLINSGIKLNPYGMMKYALEHLQCNLEADTLSESEAYTKVNKLIIMSHGYSHSLLLSPDKDGQQNALFVDQIPGINISIDVDILDIQACLCGKPIDYTYNDFSAYTCVAFEFARKEHILKVYAWDAECKFLCGWNCSFHGGSYSVYYLFNDKIVHFTVKTDNYMKFLDFIPLYAPLQY